MRCGIYQKDDNFDKQLRTDTGPIDILAISRDKQELLKIELKGKKKRFSSWVD
jgi:hypothetical protein